MVLLICLDDPASPRSFHATVRRPLADTALVCRISDLHSPAVLTQGT